MKIALVGNKVDLVSMRTVICDKGRSVCCHLVVHCSLDIVLT